MTYVIGDIVAAGGAIIGAVGVILPSFLGRQIQSEFSAWTPKATERLIDRAVSLLPEEKRERMREEWAAHVDETPGEVWKWKVAVGCLFAARRMSPRRSVRAQLYTALSLVRHGPWKRILEIAWTSAFADDKLRRSIAIISKEMARSQVSAIAASIRFLRSMLIDRYGVF